VGFVAPRMLRDDGAAQPNLDLLLVNQNVYAFANMLTGGAISNRVDVHKTVVADATPQSPRTNCQRASRQRPHGQPLIPLKANGRLLVGRAVDSPIRDLDHPCRQLPLELSKGIERSAGYGIVFHIANASFDLSFGASAKGTTGLGRQSPIFAEGLEARIPGYLAGLAIVKADQRRCIVAEDLLREAAEMLKGSVEPLEPIVLPLREECPAVESARITQDRSHEVDLHAYPSNEHELFAEIDLDLLAWWGLEPDRGQGQGPLFLTKGCDSPLQGSQIDLESATGQLLLNDNGVPFGNGTEEITNFTKCGGVEVTGARALLKTDLGSSEITAD
jgi:hypothetical protein